MDNYANEPIDMQDMDLLPQHAVNPDLFIPPMEQDLGSEPNIEKNRLRLRIGERPLARNLRTLYKLSNRELPEHLQVFMSYDIWLITHAVSIIKEGGFNNVKQIGYQMRFHDDLKVTVIELLPQTRFIKKIGASFECQADVQINGQLSMPDHINQLLDHIESLSFGGKLSLINHTNIATQLSFSVMSPIVQAVGIGDHNSEWIFTKGDEPILGDQLMIQVVLTPKYLDKLKFKARVYATISAFNLLPNRMVSNWVDLESELR